MGRINGVEVILENIASFASSIPNGLLVSRPWGYLFTSRKSQYGSPDSTSIAFSTRIFIQSYVLLTITEVLFFFNLKNFIKHSFFYN